jgi:lipoate-protein ligase A
MTTRTAVLQHGSIPLQNPGKRVFRYIRVEEVQDSREPSSLEEEAGRRLEFAEVRDAFARAFTQEVGAEESAVTPEEEAAARRIAAEKYTTDTWNLMY